jgi:hypothetical protein
VGRQRVDPKIRARFHRAQTRPPAPHALRLDEDGQMKRANNRRITSMKTLATLLALVSMSAAVLAADSCANRRARLRRTRAGQLHAAGHQTSRRWCVARLQWKNRPPRRTHARTRHGDEFHLHPLRAAKACPYATGVLMQLHRDSADDTALAKELRLVSMSFDPANDTPSAWRPTRVSPRNARPPHRGTSSPRVRKRNSSPSSRLRSGRGQKEKPARPNRPLNHTLRVFLIDRAATSATSTAPAHSTRAWCSPTCER